MDKAEERAIVRKLVGMDQEAWEAFCGGFSVPLLGFVRFCLGLGREDAEDVVQMTFVRCVRSMGTFDPARGRLFTWLKAVARNEAHTFIRKDRQRSHEIPYSALPEHVTRQILREMDSKLLPDEVLVRKDIQQLVQETLAELRLTYQQALTMRYAGGLKLSEIATVRGISEKGAESILRRSRSAFRKAFLRKVRRLGSGGIEPWT